MHLPASASSLFALWNRTGRMWQTRTEKPEAGLTSTASRRLGHDFSRIPIHPPAVEVIQAKLAINQPGDQYEQEADRVAVQVMRMPEPQLQRQRTCGGTAGPDDEYAECKSTGLQRDAKQPSASCAQPSEAPPIVHEVLRSTGQPLEKETLAFMEPRLGHDFSLVRVHNSVKAAESARAVNASAYTVGQHIVFGAGEYAPGGDRGRHLLAHELAHTIQPGHSRIQRSRGAIQQGVAGPVNSPDEFDQKEAGPTEVAGPIKEMIQRSATWKGASVHETLSPAETAFGGSDPVTRPLLNGTKLVTLADGAGAIKVPGVTTVPRPSTDPASNWMAKVDMVPAQEGGSDETVLGPGPWTKVVTKAAAGGKTGLAACTGAGNSTFTVHGNPSDDAVYKANRRHEDHHVADQEVAFGAAIAEWDKKLQDAKTHGAEFKGASAADATAALWAAMGNTPENAGRAFRSQASAKGAAFHATAAGGTMSLSNPVSNADCSTSAFDVTNPS